MSENTAESEKSVTSNKDLWDNEEGVKKIADLLRGRKGMKVRHAVEMGKRVEYCKGDKICSFLLENTKDNKNCATIDDKGTAMLVGAALIRYGYIHRSDKDPKKKKVLIPSRNHTFEKEAYYTWMYDGPTTMRNLMTAGIIIGFLCMTCFPIWPMFMKTWVWYLSVTFLLVTFVFVMVRTLVFFLMWLIGFDVWILPNIFDDDLGVADSFKPLYSFKSTPSSERMYRLGSLCVFALFCMWVYNQPTDFDEYMSLTKQFTDDIYSGKLLDDVSQQQKEEIDKVKVPDLEDLMKEEEHDMFSDVDENQIFDDYLEQKFFSDDEDQDDEPSMDKSGDVDDENDDANSKGTETEKEKEKEEL